MNGCAPSTRPRPRFPRSRSRAARSAALVAALLMLVLSGCSGAKSSSPEGGVFRVGQTQAVDSLNPFVAQASASNLVFSLIYPSLVGIGPGDELVPDFASSWQTSADGRTWTFVTRSGAQWSDGTPLTAADVAWTINTDVKYQDGPTANQAGYVANVTKATATDPTTLVVQYSKPVANVLSQLAFLFILPQHVWEPHASGDGKALTTFDNAVPIVSGGPFVFDQYVAKQKAVLLSNTSFYGTRPTMKALGLQFFGTDDAMITAFTTGQIDGLPSVAPTSVDALKKNGDVVVETAPGRSFDDLTLNNNPEQAAGHRELVDPLVREAFDIAIDRTRIVETSLLGYAQEGSSIIPPAMKNWHDTSVEPPKLDLARANQLLDQGGYAMGSRGVRMANGHPMSYTVIMPSDTDGYGQRSFQIIQSDFAKLGVELHPQHLDNAAAYTAISENHYRNFAMVMWGWSLGGVDPDDMLSYLTCGQWGAAGDSGFCEKSWDKLYREQAVTMDPDQRRALVNQMQQIAAQKKIYSVIDYPDFVSAHSRRWTDLPLIGGTWLNARSLESARLVQ